MSYYNGGLLEQLERWIGSTVTIYTASGGQSGVGITGVLRDIDPCSCTITLITCIGPSPCCALGSACTCGRICQPCGCITSVGSETVIPICMIAAFVHSAI